MPTSYLYNVYDEDYMLIKTILNTKISLRNSIKSRSEIYINKKFQKNIVRKTFGLSNLNLIIKEKASSYPITLSRLRVS
jgi:hypothetical protein